MATPPSYVYMPLHQKHNTCIYDYTCSLFHLYNKNGVPELHYLTHCWRQAMNEPAANYAHAQLSNYDGWRETVLNTACTCTLASLAS